MKRRAALFGRDQPAKWVVEVRFARRLSKRERRRIERALAGVLRWYREEVIVGIDGIVCEQWPVKWPGIEHGKATVTALRLARVPFRIRAAPFGRDCSGCLPDDPLYRCAAASNVFDCDPQWRPDDWVAFD